MALKAGSRYGSIMNPGHSMWSPMGSQAQYYDVGGITEPDDNQAYVNLVQGNAIRQKTDLEQQKFDLMKGLFGKVSGGDLFGGGSFNMQPANVPAPRYISAGPVWSQSQIDARAGLDRSNLITQANNESRAFTGGLASRGFSPFSPFAGFNQQNNLMRAYSGAAANETNLNFNSAKANSDARLQAAQVNADMYRSHANALSQANQLNADFALKRTGQGQDFIGMLLRSLGG